MSQVDEALRRNHTVGARQVTLRQHYVAYAFLTAGQTFPSGIGGIGRRQTLADLQALKTAIEDVSSATKIPPARILVLWRSKGDESVTPDVYEFLTKESARVKIRGSTFVCSLELAMERDDGTYDFIPVVVEPVMTGAGSPAAA